MIEQQMDAAELSRDWGWDVSALAVGCAGLGVWEIAPATATWRCSPRCNELLGIAANDEPLDALSQEDRRRFGEAIARAMHGGEYGLELRARERWLSAIGRVVRDGRGLASIVGTLQDVTAQKVALEEREFRLAEVAHDLVNPLGAMALAVGIARKDGRETPQMLSRIDALIGAAQHIVADLLEFGRSQLTGCEQARVALAEVCRSVIADASIVHPGRDIVFDLRDDAVGQWDGQRLRQAFRNLLGNALQHGDRRTPVEVSLIDSGERAVLTVLNRGPPVPDEIRAHLFEPFRRSKANRRGVGLGLYIVKRIVEAHGGFVEMSSDEARTVFQVTLPKK
ncbi:MAG: ATP-binding protein [Myxococcales bacterium]